MDDANHANREICFYLILDAFEQFVHAVEVLTSRVVRGGMAAKSFEYLHDDALYRGGRRSAASLPVAAEHFA